MDNLNDYILERIRIDNTKTIDFTKPNKFEGKFEITGIIISTLGGRINIKDDIDWYYCQYQDKLIFFSPKSFYMPFIKNISDIKQYYDKKYSMWFVAWVGSGTTPNQFINLVNRSSLVIFDDRNVDKFKSIDTSKDVDILVDKWYSVL